MADNNVTANAITRLGRSKFLIFFDWTRDFTFTDNVWTRLKKSTANTYTANENTEDFDYIDSDDTVTEIVGNSLAIEFDQALLDGDTNYENLEKMMAELPTGEEAKVPILYCFGGSSMRAVRAIATITDKALTPTDGTIGASASISDKTTGTYTISDGTPTFVEPTP